MTSKSAPPKANLLVVGEPLIEYLESKDMSQEGVGKNDARINGYAGEMVPNFTGYLRHALKAHKIEDGVKVDAFSAIGDDEYSKGLLAVLNGHGVGTDHIKIIPGGKLGTVTQYFDEAGAPVFFKTGEERFKHVREHSATRDMLAGVDDDGMRTLLKDRTHLVVSAVGLGCSREREKIIRLMQLAKEEFKIPVVFSTNMRPAVWKFGQSQGDKEGWKRQVREWSPRALEYTDILFASHGDENIIWGDASPKKTLERLQKYKIPEIIVTDGDKPMHLSYRDGSRRISTEVPIDRKAVEVDPSGAGDAFAATYLAARLQKIAPRMAARIAGDVGAQVVGYKGAMLPEPNNLTVKTPADYAEQAVDAKPKSAGRGA